MKFPMEWHIIPLRKDVCVYNVYNSAVSYICLLVADSYTIHMYFYVKFLFLYNPYISFVLSNFSFLKNTERTFSM